MINSSTSGFNTTGMGVQSRYSRVGMRYPSPFFDLSQYYFPQNPRSLFKFASFYAQTFGPVYAFVTKMSSYALTDLVWGSDASSNSNATDSEWKSRWEHQIVENMRIYDMAYQLGLHYWTYGNFYASVFYPFVRWLICPSCGHRKRAKDFPKKGYRWANYRFRGQCEGCRSSVTFRVRDQMVRTTRGLRVINWNPESMLVIHNEATGENEYKYQPSEVLLRRIRRGDRKVIESTPWPFIKAAKISGYVDIDPNNLLHVRAPSPAGNSMGMGHPPIMAAMKDIFHVQLMKRAQEANAIERTIPMSVIHPAPMPGTTWDPIQTVNLKKMIEHTQEEILHGRQDPNYQAVTALPLGRTDLWGEGKNLMLVPEIRGWIELIIADLAVPNEFIFGGLQFSGSNVSLRMLENQILTFTGGYKRLTRFVIDKVARFLRWPKIPWAWTPFKMADDIQLKQHLIMLSQMNKIGDSTLLGSFSKNPDEEHTDIKKSLARQNQYQEMQMLGQTRTQIKAQEIQQDAMEAQQEEMGIQQTEPGAEPGVEEVSAEGEEDPEQFAQRIAEQLQGQPQEVVQQILQSVSEQSPELAQMIISLLQQGGQQAQQQEAGMGQPQQQMAQQQQMMQPPQQMAQQQMAQQQQMMQPQPQQLPPRRGPGSAAI